MIERKKWTEMTGEELAEATREFDIKFVAEKGTPLSEAGRKALARSAVLHRKRRGHGGLRSEKH